MAIQLQDLNPQFAAHPTTGDIVKSKGVNAISASISNILKTEPTERVMRPTIGTPLTQVLFEPIDGITAGLVRSIITNSIREFEPRATIKQITVVPEPLELRYHVTITFTVNTQIEPVILETYLTRER